MVIEELVFKMLFFGGEGAISDDLGAVATQCEVLSMLAHILQLIIKDSKINGRAHISISWG